LRIPLFSGTVLHSLLQKSLIGFVPLTHDCELDTYNKPRSLWDDKAASPVSLFFGLSFRDWRELLIRT
jgi:hypothetical protein